MSLNVSNNKLMVIIIPVHTCTCSIPSITVTYPYRVKIDTGINLGPVYMIPLKLGRDVRCDHFDVLK